MKFVNIQPSEIHVVREFLGNQAAYDDPMWFFFYIQIIIFEKIRNDFFKKKKKIK